MDIRQHIRDRVEALLLKMALEGVSWTLHSQERRADGVILARVLEGFSATVRMEVVHGMPVMPGGVLRPMMDALDGRSVQEYIEGLLRERGLVKWGGHWWTPDAEVPPEMQVSRGGRLIRRISELPKDTLSEAVVEGMLR